MNQSDDSLFIPLQVLQKWWKTLIACSWAIFLSYEAAIGLDFYLSEFPICPHVPDNYHIMYWEGMYFIMGGFCMILASIIVRFVTTNENDTDKFFLYWISLHIITISCISTLLTIVYNWGGICMDGLHVASSAAVWGEWFACSPLILFITITMPSNDRIRTKDIILIVTFMLALFLGFSIIYVSSIAGIFLFCIATLCTVPTLLIPYYYTMDQLYDPQNMNLYNQYMYVSKSITFIFPIYFVNYTLSLIRIYPEWVTIVIYQMLSLLTKGLFVSFIMDIHLNVLIDIDKALMREKQANETRRSFMKYIFHEVRTPLNSLSIGIEYLQDITKENDTTKQTLDALYSSCLYMNETLNNVLNLHKIEEHKWDVEVSAFTLKELIYTIKTTFQSVLISKKITFVHHIIPDIVVSDRIKIQHIVSNLVSNAIKFTKSNGCITVKIEKDSTQQQLLISVKDTGCGISAEHQKRLFMNFSQIRPTIIQDGGGSGLGLMFCKNIALLLNGDIRVKHSEPDRGTEFECHIPVRFKSIMADMVIPSVTLSSILEKEEAKEVAKPTTQIHILVTDDHEASRNIFVMFLKRLKMDTICYAEDGQIGLSMVMEQFHRFNLLIVDNLMPNMTGVEMTRKLREKGYPYLIIGLTGNVMEQDMNEFLEAGADYVFMKPIKMQELSSLIRFIEKNGVNSKTSQTMKLVLTDKEFHWITLTPPVR